MLELRTEPSSKGWSQASVSRAIFSVVLLAIACGCAADPIPVHNEELANPRFLRYTLRATPSGLAQDAFRSNYLSFPAAFPAGTKVTIPFYSDRRMELDVNGMRCRVLVRDLPFPTDPDGIKRTLDKYFATSLEELNLNALDPSTLRSVNDGVAMIGMTKDQVLLALGYPSHVGLNTAPADEMTRDQIFQQNVWHYRYNEVMLIPSWYTYQFDNDGKLVRRVP